MNRNLRVQTEFMMWGGCSPTLSTMQGGNQEPKILESRQLGFMDNGTGKHQSNTVYDENALCPNITTVEGGGTQQIKVCESQIVAMRGRNPDNPSDKTEGSPTEQRLEANTQGTSNCLTSVQKDNMVLESVLAVDEQNMNVRNETFGTLTTDGSSPKHNNRVMIKQATKKGYTECELGGGRFKFP